jgi:ApaG protein
MAAQHNAVPVAGERAFWHGAPMSTAVTKGIVVTVESQYLMERSSPVDGQYAFSYKVRIYNQGDVAAQLRTRHWIITDGDGQVQEVRGAGVVGAQPHLEPGQAFEYTSWCMLKTPHGSMHGSYQMVREDGEQFDAVIAPFPLALPYSLN